MQCLGLHVPLDSYLPLMIVCYYCDISFEPKTDGAFSLFFKASLSFIVHSESYIPTGQVVNAEPILSVDNHVDDNKLRF